MGPDSLEELLLFPPLIFNFLFDELDKFPRVDWISSNDLELGCLFLSEWFGGDWHVLGVERDFFENSELEFLILLVLDKFELSLEESGLLLVPLQGFEDVLIEFLCGILVVRLEGRSK